MNREERKQSADETIELYRKLGREKPRLDSIVINSLQITPKIPEHLKLANRIHVCSEDVVKRIHELDGHIGVMNFASAVHPGGGYEKGANAQEESLCRNSFLGIALNDPRVINRWYKQNRRNNRYGISPVSLIYTNNVPFIKLYNPITDKEELQPRKLADVVTVAAPNQGVGGATDKEYYQNIYKKILLTLRAFKNAGCTQLVLGAFGCGVFKNDPRVVAHIFKDILDRVEFAGAFEDIYFSIFGKDSNFIEFNKAFNEKGDKQNG